MQLLFIAILLFGYISLPWGWPRLSFGIKQVPPQDYQLFNKLRLDLDVLSDKLDPK